MKSLTPAVEELFADYPLPAKEHEKDQPLIFLYETTDIVSHSIIRKVKA